MKNNGTLWDIDTDALVKIENLWPHFNRTSSDLIAPTMGIK
jgi:hypothetical protein